MTLRRLLPPVLFLLLLAAGTLALAAAGTGPAPRASAQACPPGFAGREERMRHERLERAADAARPFQGEGPGEERLADAVGADGPMQRIARGPACVNRRVPEAQGELMAVQTDDAKRSTGGVAEAVRPGAHRDAVRRRDAMAAGGNRLPGSAGTWRPAGTGPLIADDERFDEVNGSGLADLAGRISDFAYDPEQNRLFAAAGEGGVWQSDDQGGTWRSIGDSLPTQAVGGIAYSPDAGGTLIVTTGDSVFGGGGTFAGLGAYRKVLSGGDWQRATGVPDGVITFKVAVDPTDARKVYAGTGAGLFRSTDAGATFENVRLPTGRDRDGEPLEPDCTGVAPTVAGCFQANMVTDVVVQGAGNEATPEGSPGSVAGSVVAVVGWRAGDKRSPKRPGFPDGYVESPGNGVYRSGTGETDTFDRIDAPSAFGTQANIGRIELGLATGPEQDHNYLYAIVEDAARFNGAPAGIDAPGEAGAPAVPNNTALNGIFVSDDFGESWIRMEDAEQLKNPASGSALTGTACATQYCPGIQAWYNEWIAPDPTGQVGGVPTRVTFGLEEIWQNASPVLPQTGPTDFKVVAPYFSGTSCLFLTVPFPACATTAGNPAEANKTAHPDHHAAIYLPDAAGTGARLVVGHDGGVNVQDVTTGEDVDPDGWGRGANQGFNTLLPYDAQIAKDGTIYAGLQDNGELRIEPDGRQFMTFGGDGAFSAVDPDESDTTYEGLPNGTINKSADGGQAYEPVFPDADGTGDGDTYQFINPFTMDPRSAQHLMTAGNGVYETDDAGESWEQVFDLGTEPAESGGALRRMSALDVRSAGGASAAYVAYCGVCDRLNTALPFANGIATNVAPDGTAGTRLSAGGWRLADAEGLPERYVTSVQIDPEDAATVYVTVAGYSRRWLTPGAGGEEVDPTPGNVFKSTDAGDTFMNISGSLEGIPANWSAVREGRLIVATNAGVFMSAGTDGGTYEVLGSGLPAAPAFTLEMKPKASADEPDTLIAATQGRGVYRYDFADPEPAATPTPTPTPAPGPAPGGGEPPGGSGDGGGGTDAGPSDPAPGAGDVLPGTRSGGPGPAACAASSGFASVAAMGSARGVRLGFERTVQRPVTIDVFRVSVGRRVIRERLVARFADRTAPFTWTGLSNRGGARKRVGDGHYFARFRIRGEGEENDVRRLVFERSRGIFAARPDFYRRANCDLLRTYKLERPVFGGRGSSPLGVAYRLTARSRVQVVVTRGTRTIRRFAPVTVPAGRTTRLRLPSRGLARGDYRVRIVATSGADRVTSTLTARRL